MNVQELEAILHHEGDGLSGKATATVPLLGYHHFNLCVSSLVPGVEVDVDVSCHAIDLRLVLGEPRQDDEGALVRVLPPTPLHGVLLLQAERLRGRHREYVRV